VGPASEECAGVGLSLPGRVGGAAGAGDALVDALLVERWFAELTTKWIKRGTHRSVRDVVASIRTWIANWNDDPKPYVWHKTADQILDSLAAYCQPINDSGH